MQNKGAEQGRTGQDIPTVDSHRIRWTTRRATKTKRRRENQLQNHLRIGRRRYVQRYRGNFDDSEASRTVLHQSNSQSFQIATGVLSGLAVAFAAIKAWSHCKRNGNEIPNASTFLWFLIFCCGVLGNVFIFVSFCAGLYTFVFYKGQAVLHVLLPSDANEENVRIFVIVAFCLKVTSTSSRASIDSPDCIKWILSLARRGGRSHLSPEGRRHVLHRLGTAKIHSKPAEVRLSSYIPEENVCE